MSLSLSPLTFEPIFQERIWGGQKLADLFGKKLPPNKRIGESWELVDRDDAQSVVVGGPYNGKTLHHLWKQHRREIFGEGTKAADDSAALPDRFPLLIKLLDAEDKLSLQVHPPAGVASDLRGESKTEFWYVSATEPGAEVFVGLRQPFTPEQFGAAVENGTLVEHVHRVRTHPGAAMFLPAGRFHAIGAGNVLIEIQQNSDTTYRVFDWERVDEQGRRRELHIESALRCIDFNDVRPELVRPEGELLVRCPFFEVHKWNLAEARLAMPAGQFAIFCCLNGGMRCGGVEIGPGQFCLVPAVLQDREVKPVAEGTTLLRVTIP